LSISAAADWETGKFAALSALWPCFKLASLAAAIARWLSLSWRLSEWRKLAQVKGR
jgi:hypothetical protein